MYITCMYIPLRCLFVFLHTIHALTTISFPPLCQVHERHAFTVTNAGQLNQQSGSDWATHLQALESRRMLIEAHASIPTISKDNFK